LKALPCECRRENQEATRGVSAFFTAPAETTWATE
jgi:hypothetical protein